ncbi:hypothetical protein JNUCC0626_33665 [Lentzea sp. JNUCC 0626]|uniref:hypothetical protein n=1 Tax=Lentzea sp. JNUCC 0626 TaxID=3367513 RepID=UPI0037487E6C
MLRRTLAVLFGGLVLAAMSAAPAQAEPATVSAANVGCFTTFVPPAPQGGSMTQYYQNCNGHTVRVGRGFVDGSGQISVWVSSCQDVAPGQTISWYYPSTQNVNYRTVICDTTHTPPLERPDFAGQCWTSFYPDAPNGGPLLQWFKNCNPHPITVGTGNSDASGQIAIRPSSCQTLNLDRSVRWRYESTVPGTNYSTMICLYG